MDRRHHYPRLAAGIAAGAALIPLLAACGGSSGSSASGTTATVTATVGSPTGTGASVPACGGSGLAVTLDTNGNGAAGSVYYTLRFTNGSGRPCTVGGFPGVSAISGSGAQLGSPAGRDTTTAARALTLAAGQTATATLRVVDAGNFSASACGPVTATGLRVYPPNQTVATQIAFAFRACSTAGPVYLTVGPLTASGSSGGGGATATACRTSGLTVRLSPSGSGAAGSIYYPLTFTNGSGRTCTLTGYPGVSAVGPSGSQLGSAAGRNPVYPTTVVTLANGHSATAMVQVAEVGNYPASACRPATAAGLRVYPPNQTQSTTVAFTGSVCSTAGPAYLHVTAVK